MCIMSIVAIKLGKKRVRVQVAVPGVHVQQSLSWVVMPSVQFTRTLVGASHPQLILRKTRCIRTEGVSFSCVVRPQLTFILDRDRRERIFARLSSGRLDTHASSAPFSVSA